MRRSSPDCPLFLPDFPMRMNKKRKRKLFLFPFFDRQGLFVLDQRPDILNQHGDGDGVEAAFGDDDVRIFLRRLDELLVHGLHRGRVLRDDRLHGAAPVADVAQNAARQPDVGIRVDEYLDVHQLARA